MNKLSIDVADEVECYAIDSAAMQEQQDKRIKEMSEYMETFGITPADDKSEMIRHMVIRQRISSHRMTILPVLFQGCGQ